jgi:nucleotide-binding universal stress UspA family protein
MMRIFAATDLTPAGTRVIDLAASLAEASKGELLIAHVADLPPEPGPLGGGEEVGPALEALRARVRQRVQAATTALDDECKRVAARGIQCETRLLEGHPWEVLITEASREGVDLMVVGPHAPIEGHSVREALRGRLLGTTADRVVRHAPCPVLVAPSDDLPRTFQGATWLVGVDFSPASRSAVQLTGQIARATEGRIVLGHVVAAPGVDDGEDETTSWRRVLREESRKQALQQLRDLATEVGVADLLEGERAAHGPAAETLCDTVSEVGADVLVIGTHGRTGVARLLLGSTAEKSLRHAQVPVLVVRAMDTGRA